MLRSVTVSAVRHVARATASGGTVVELRRRGARSVTGSVHRPANVMRRCIHHCDDATLLVRWYVSFSS